MSMSLEFGDVYDGVNIQRLTGDREGDFDSTLCIYPAWRVEFNDLYAILFGKTVNACRPAIFDMAPKAGLSPIIGVAPISSTFLATASMTIGWVMVQSSGALSLIKFGFKSTLFPFL